MTVSEDMDQVVNVSVPQEEEEHFSERTEEPMADVPFPQERVFDAPVPQLIEERISQRDRCTLMRTSSTRWQPTPRTRVRLVFNPTHHGRKTTRMIWCF